jgi:hypothetical protein
LLNSGFLFRLKALAGVPAIVLARAKAILKELELGATLPSGAPASLRKRNALGAVQLDMFAPQPPQPAPSKVEATLRGKSEPEY